jgi:hypothetical protein
MAVDWWARAFGLIGIVISLGGLAISAANYWHGRPRLKTTAQTSMVHGFGDQQDEWRPCVVVTITNDGGAEVLITNVQLQGRRLNGRLLKGPGASYELKARGGSASWYFDHADLRQQLSESVTKELADNTQPVEVRPVIRIGRRVRSPRGAVIYVNPPGVIGDKRRTSWRGRIDVWRREWSRPVPTLDPISMLTAEDFDARQSILVVSNRYRRTAAPSELVLTVKHADERREPLAGQPPMPVPRIRGRRSVNVRVPFIDDSNGAPDDQFEWFLRTREGFGGQPVAAALLSQRSHFAPQVEQLRIIRHDPELPT